MGIMNSFIMVLVHVMNMTSKDDFLSRLEMRGCDRTPVFLRDLTLGLDALNVPTDAVFGRTFNSKLSAECVLALQKEVGHDAVVGSIGTYSLEAFGGTTKNPADGIPYLSDAPFDDISKMDLYQPDDIRDGLLSGIRESYRIVGRTAPELAIVMNVSGPVNTAGNFRGVEKFMMDTEMNPDIAQEITEFSKDVMISMIDFIGTENCDSVFLAAATDSPDMLGPENYRKYVLKHVKTVTEHVHSYGKPTIFHPHGIFSTIDRRDLLSDSIDTGIDGFQFAEGNEPAGILRETKGRCAIMGGVDAFTTLLIGPEKRIVRDTDGFLDILGHEDFILTCSCSIHRGLPIRNVKTMVDEVRKFNSEVIS